MYRDMLRINLFLFVPFLLLVHVTSAVALPPCPTDPSADFHNCEGFNDFGNGDQFLGEYKDGGRYEGTLFFSNGDVWTGQWNGNELVGGKRYSEGKLIPFNFD